jgi:hypothetical protein
VRVFHWPLFLDADFILCFSNFEHNMTAVQYSTQSKEAIELVEKAILEVEKACDDEITLKDLDFRLTKNLI